MVDYKIAETNTFSEKIKAKRFEKIFMKITSFIYPQLRQNPFFGKNIKKMSAEFENVYRYRVGDFRLFYTIDQPKKLIIILGIDNIKDAYKKK